LAAKPDDLERLIHETLEDLGWDADAAQVAERVRRLDIGLPVEDEFAVLCSWLGKCELIHKLDQHQMPRPSKERYQVPDMLAYFSTQKDHQPVLIEIKSKTDKTLSFRPDYFQKLQNYADLMGAPLLIAWKYHSFWVLFEARHMIKADVNFNISFGAALKESLLGVLAGDFTYRIGAGAGIHLKFRKEQLVAVEESEQEKSETWNVRLSEVIYTSAKGELAGNVPGDVQALLNTWDLELQEEDHDDHIWSRYIASAEVGLYAHMALIRLLDWNRQDGEKIRWRREARRERLNTIKDFRAAVLNALDLKIVEHVLDVQPHSWPSFLPQPGNTFVKE